MRKDLTKVLCERERRWSSRRYPLYRCKKEFDSRHSTDFDDEELKESRASAGAASGSRESMKFRYGWDTKEFGEHLSPLYGIIRKNVGRKWDDVYSELSKAFDRRSVTGQHIFEHLWDQLANVKDTFVLEGEVWVRGRRFFEWIERVQDSTYRYYVDPRDGILKSNLSHYKTYTQLERQRRAKRELEELKTRRVLDEETELRWVKGVWFEVKFKNLDRIKAPFGWPDYSKVKIPRMHWDYPDSFDVLEKRVVRAGKVAVSKRTLSHKELKKHGLVT